MKTPLGWARANIVYDKLQGPPEPGSVMEALCLMVQARRELKELYSMRTVVQAVMLGQHPENQDTGEAVKEAYELYKGSLMPFLEGEIKRGENDVVKAIREEVARGPIAVQPLSSVRVESKLNQMKMSEVPTLGSRVRQQGIKKW